MENKDLTKVKISMNLDVDTDYVDELSNIINHHIDWLIDLEGEGGIKSIYDCELTILD